MCFGNSGNFSLNLLIWNQFIPSSPSPGKIPNKWLGWHPPFGVTSRSTETRNKSGEQHLGKTSQATPATWHELLNHQLLKFSLKGLEYKVSKVAVARAMKVKENQRKVTTVPTLLWAYTKYLHVNVECEQNFQHSQLQLFIIIVYFFSLNALAANHLEKLGVNVDTHSMCSLWQINGQFRIWPTSLQVQSNQKKCFSKLLGLNSTAFPGTLGCIRDFMVPTNTRTPCHHLQLVSLSLRPETIDTPGQKDRGEKPVLSWKYSYRKCQKMFFRWRWLLGGHQRVRRSVLEWL